MAVLGSPALVGHAVHRSPRRCILSKSKLACVGPRGRSVLVAAPTSGGKTACGEAAVDLALARRRRAIYTTPLKALSAVPCGACNRRAVSNSALLKGVDG